jgi:hypothetical protein
VIIFRLELDPTPVQRQLTALERVQLPFATSLALNNLAKKAQENIRAHYRTVFTLRRPEFIEKQGVKITRFSTKRDLSAELGIDRKADFLTKFQTGGERPVRGRHIAIPVQAKRNKRDIITAGQRPRSLIDRLGKRKGAGGVFVVKDARAGRTPGVYQRTGRRGRQGVRLLFALEDRAQIPASLQFLQIGQRTAEQSWATLFEQALQQALRSAR